MDCVHRLLVLTCSQRKHASPELLPAIERYDGPSFRVLRSFLRNHPTASTHLDVFILSAAHGLIPASQYITSYDQLMTTQRAEELSDQVLPTFASLLHTEYTELCIAMSKTYQSALPGWTTFVPSSMSVTIVKGSQGVKLAQLKRWLWEDLATAASITPRSTVVKSRGVARLRGIELRLTPSQVFEQARIALKSDGADAHSSRLWYVDLDDQRVAPKWLVSVLTGLSVNNFTADDARRVLSQLGIPIQRLCKEGEE